MAVAQAQFDVVVIGEGISGLTAAGELARAGLKVATLEAQLFGGLVINVNELDPAPDGATAASGAELASELMQANGDAGVESIQEPATDLRDAGDMREVVTQSGVYRARHVVVASGARLKKLGVPGEAEYEGRGVSQCADCDGPMYQNETVIVVGGGDSALQEALVLSNYCGAVRLVHRGGAFSARDHFAEQVRANDKIDIILNATLEAILGGQMVEKVRVRHNDGRLEELPCAGVFAYVGLEPNTDFLPLDIARNAQGFVETNATLETARQGVWAIGAARSGFGGMLNDAVADARAVAAAIGTRFDR
jgi:thioredoxin reductase (NADPH)